MGHDHSHDHAHEHAFPARELLHAKGLRATPQRVIILGALADIKGHRHLTARDVFLAAQDQLPGLNVTTVYRTLEGLHEVGLVDLMVCGHDNVRFSFRHPDHRHGHLVCHSCGTVITLDMGRVAEVASILQRDTGFVIEQDHLTLSGQCGPCATKSS